MWVGQHIEPSPEQVTPQGNLTIQDVLSNLLLCMNRVKNCSWHYFKGRCVHNICVVAMVTSVLSDIGIRVFLYYHGYVAQAVNNSKPLSPEVSAKKLFSVTPKRDKVTV